MMIPEPEIIARAIAAVERAHVVPSPFRNFIAKLIREEFAMPDDWQVVEHKPGVWSLVNQRTGEVYKGKATHGAMRTIVFQSVEAARRKAYLKNKELVK